MSQYGQGTKNPPWARSGVAQSGAQVQSMMPAAMTQMGNPSLLQYPTVFQTGSMGQQATLRMTSLAGVGQNSATLQSGLSDSQIYGGVGAIQYPTRALNSAAFGGSSGVVSGPGTGGGSGNMGGGGGGGSVSSSSSGASSQSNSHSMGKNQRVFTGTVTKIQDNFGFVDEDVFFQTSCCVKGSTPQVDDRVLVEAVYNPAMPFKWNATRIQVLNSKDGQGSGSRFSQGYNAVPPPSNEGGRLSGPGGSGRNFQQGGDRGGGNRNDRRNRNRPPSKERDDRKRKREDTRDRSLERDRDRVRSPPPKRKSKSPVRRPRPVARYQPPARYAVVVPKFALANSEFDVIELKKRYANLYVPSDFFFSHSKWSESLPLGKPFSLNSPCQFHVMNREVDPVYTNDAVLEPSDADYSYVAKVMLLSSPGLEELFSKSGCGSSDGRGSRSVTPEDSESAEDNGGVSQHPSRLIHFLVGTRGQETMAIGGPWSPSLDGADPVNDPSVLIRTAIRTCKALTAIDLTQCTQWLRFLEVNYYRGESCHKGKLVPARVETVVLFVPDVWSSAPSRLEWDSIAGDYKAALERKINPSSSGSMDDSTASASEISEEKPDAEIKEGENSGADVEMKREPTHFSQLDVKSMKVQELRDELDSRSLPTKGIKSQLAARLSKALKSEAEAEGEPILDCSIGESEGASESENVTSESLEKEETQPTRKDSPSKEVEDPSPASSNKEKEKEIEKPVSVKMSEKDRLVWEKRYKLPDTPHIIVHPNRTAKAGRFNCAAISLSSLLGYRIDDTKEHSFEVSLFAEVFNEMLMRDYGFSIYLSLMNAPEKIKEDDKDKKKPKDGSKDKDKDKESKDKPKEEKSDKDADSVKEEKTEAISDHETDKKKDDDAKKIAEIKKVKVVDSNLLLACFYFDTSRIGYFLEKDLEDLLFSIGLTISRSQVRKLVQKVALRDQIYYRKLAERFVEIKAEDSAVAKKEGVELTAEELKEIGMGNKRLLKAHWASNSVKTESQMAIKSEGADMETSSGLVKYNGAVVDIEKLMNQLSKSEKNRLEAEKTLSKIKADFLKAKENCSKTERTVKDLNGEINSLNDKLASAQSTLSTIMANEKKYASACREIYERLGPLVNAGEKQSSVIEIVEGEEDSKKSH